MLHVTDWFQLGVAMYLDFAITRNILAFGVGYLCLQNVLRFRRERALITRYRKFTAITPSNDSKAPHYLEQSARNPNGVKVDDGRKGLDLSKMSFLQASEIQRDLSHLEFPYTFGHSLELGFIQTLAFPYPAKILNDTRQISRPEAMPKRLADTSILMQNIYNFPPDHPRFQLAISRINYIHSRYTRIQNPDMLYTLAVFACNPWDYVDRDEWRQMNVLEVAGLGTFWKNIGECLKVDMTFIKNMAITHASVNESGRKDVAAYTSSDTEGWRDGYDFMLDLRAYMRWHETGFAEFSQDVDALVSTTFDVGTQYIPTAGLQRLVKDILVTEFQEKWQRAMGYVQREHAKTDAGTNSHYLDSRPPPNIWTSSIFRYFISIRRFYLRHLALPAFWSSERTSPDPDPKTGLYQQVDYVTFPYYVRPSLWNRYGPATWPSWLFGVPLPGDEGVKYRPEGYSLEEIGPERMEGKGKEWMEEDRRWCQEMMGASICPFATMMRQ
ncbi:hypothetical protein QFC21_005715 [Naganishia friedmannii]|uniref:Uncharacterized protein n=1 Tax=Naganishia friedmannii TaxID=89922 RepID=A0ACC2V7K2_9TREE|nr:hypothetical protein QFC21_005715 [Naganishia friedmannii]